MGESQAIGRHKGRGKHNIISYSTLQRKMRETNV